ncbi:MAG: hypothetical protein QOF63_2219 [Thermoanaerobaculia bacterium]|nr:hypothetical protein [Thermoanaerobaculia bacterium]
MNVRTAVCRQLAGLRPWHAVLLLILFIVPCSGMYAAQRAGGSLDVSVRARSTHGSLSGVYVALVPLDAPAYRPTMETIVDGAVKWEGITAGDYVLLAEASSFEPAMQNVTISEGRSDQVTLEFQPLFELSGSVTDTAGRPIKDAAVSHPRIVPPSSLGVMSNLARRNARHLRTTTDENGLWKIGVIHKELYLLVEAPGYESAWVSWSPDKGPRLPPIKLQPGSSLRVVTNRAAPDLVLTLVPKSPVNTSIPPVWQDRIWARDVETTSVEWKSMPAGEYDLVASWPDPRRFADPVPLRQVHLSGNGIEEIRVELPNVAALTTKTARIRIPKSDVLGLRAFVRTSSGAKEVAAASENVMRGRVLYANTDPASDVFFTTEGEVILGRLPAATAQNQEQAPAIIGVKFPRANGTLRVSVPEHAELPSFGNARFDECTGDAAPMSFVLPVSVGKGGDAALPLLVGCHALTLRFESFSPVAVRPQARAREKVWLGAHKLTSAASAQIHVVHKSDGTNVAEAVVTASVDRGGTDRLIIAKGISRADGWLTLGGLPAGEEIIFRAEDSRKIAGMVTRTIDPGKEDVIDPLPLTEAGQLTVIPHLEASFKSENPKAGIVGVIVLPENGGKADMKSVDLNSSMQEAVFPGLKAGSWKVVAVVAVDGLTQPIDVTVLKIEDGDKKKIEPEIKLLVVSGHLTSHGRGVAASIQFTDPPGPGAIARRVRSEQDGLFRAILPRPGYYGIAARRQLADPDIELAPIQIEGSVYDLRIELPEGSLSVRVFSDEKPAADAEVTVSMLGDSREQNQLLRLGRTVRTNLIGEVVLDELQDGIWLVRARGNDERVAEKTIEIAAARPASVRLDLDGGSTLQGSVFDSSGNPAGAATVNCIYSGSDGIPRVGFTDTDSWGKFHIHFPKPAPERLQCGVATADGGIGTFVTAPVDQASWTLPAATGAVTLTNWSDRGNRDRYWLLGADGGLFDVSWAARKWGMLDGPFTIRKVPAGTWSVVRVDSAGAFSIVAGGGAGQLPKLAQVRLGSGEHDEIDMKSGTSSRR